MTNEIHIRTIRRAFTLIEILVVIAILAILAGLGAWGVFAVIGNQQSRNTQNTIMVVNKVLQDHWKYVIEEANKDPVISPAVIALAGNDPDGRRARVLWRKVRLMEAFPQAFNEIGTIPGVVPAIVPAIVPPVYAGGANALIPANYPGIQQRYIADYQRRIPVAGKWFSSTQPSKLTNINMASSATSPCMATPSPACLLIALSTNRNGSSLRQDDIKFAVKDTDSDGIPEIVDGWGHPLMFTRFDDGTSVTVIPPNPNPVQAVNPAAANPNEAAAKYSDPSDPEGMLLTSAWYTPNNAKIKSVFLYTLSSNGGVSANYVIPSIMSAGRDGIMQMAIPSDDIFSYQLRGGN